LASWGMYRGSSFLLQHAHTVHLGVIDLFVAPRLGSGSWEPMMTTPSWCRLLS
jgi:hypothetical protein